MSPSILKTRRSRLLAAVLLTIAAIFVIRLFYLQVIQHEYYVSLANEEQLKKDRIPATRGWIYAKNGDEPVVLVRNETVYTLFADPATVTEREKAIEVLNRIAGGNLRDNFEELLARDDTRYQVLGTKLTRLQADKIKEEKLRGIGFTPMSQRVYPENGLAGQVLGFVNTEGVGSYGVESYLNDALRGTDGRLETVTDVSDVPLTIGDRNIREPAKNGENVVLTIDRNVQSYAESALQRGLERTGATEGSVIVMDPQSGKVMAMANLPGYSPGEYFNVSSEEVARFNNNVISKPYEPGSVIKTFTMATGLEKNVVKPSDTFNNTDLIVIDGWRIGNATTGITGNITFQTALEWSLNTGFVTVAQRLGDGKSITPQARESMYEYYHDHFRLGELTDIELANESKGTLYSPEDGEGNAVRYANMSFGQGMNTTMIQVAPAFSALINGGNYYKPTIIDGEMVDGVFKQKSTPTPTATSVVRSETSQTMRQMMEQARTSAFGHLDKSGYSIGGKTGTSQVAEAGGYSDDETIGSYLGYGGGNTPEYVIMVAISSDGKQYQGSRDAMPIFTDISNWLIDYLKIQPKG